MSGLSSWLTARANALLARFQKFTRRHLGPSGDLKVLSIVVAAVIYYFIQNIISFSGTYAVPLLVTVREANVAVRSQSEEEVKVTLKGPEGDVRAVDASNLRVRLKLSHPEAGTERQMVALRDNDGRAPAVAWSASSRTRSWSNSTTRSNSGCRSRRRR